VNYPLKTYSELEINRCESISIGKCWHLVAVWQNYSCRVHLLVYIVIKINSRAVWNRYKTAKLWKDISIKTSYILRRVKTWITWKLEKASLETLFSIKTGTFSIPPLRSRLYERIMSFLINIYVWLWSEREHYQLGFDFQYTCIWETETEMLLDTHKSSELMQYKSPLVRWVFRMLLVISIAFMQTLLCLRWIYEKLWGFTVKKKCICIAIRIWQISTNR